MTDDDSGNAGRDKDVLKAMRLSSEQPAGSPPGRELSPAARRALAEAEERRRAAKAADGAALPKEVNGRDGPEPIRYGDWEKNGIISDF